MDRDGKINTPTSQNGQYGVLLPQGTRDGHLPFENMMLDASIEIATNPLRRNQFFSARLATVARGHAFGAATGQSLWNRLHHPDLKWLKVIMQKYGFFDWINDNLDRAVDGDYPGQVLRTLERHMFRCKGYSLCPSHYEIPMCYFGVWSAANFNSCRLIHWKSGVEAAGGKVSLLHIFSILKTPKQVIF